MSDGLEATAKQALRVSLLDRRRSLPTASRAMLDRQLCVGVLDFFASRPGARVSAFWAFRGEPDLTPALEMLHSTDRQLYLPVLKNRQMTFRRWIPEARLEPNQFGIPEPLDGEPCAADRLDWVLMPLVAFSAAGARLGMGGGFYDRCFAFRLAAPPGCGPRLIGVAYGFQQVDSLPIQAWDVPMDAVITDRGLLECRPLESPSA